MTLTSAPRHTAPHDRPVSSVGRVVDHLAIALERAGVQHVFGVMGNGNAHLLDSLAVRTDVRFTALRHEAGAVAAADAYARVSGTLGVASCTYGAGFTNVITPLAEAVRAGTPLLVVTGDAPASGRRPFDVDQPALAAAVGARTFTVDAAAPATCTLAAAQYALDHRTAVVLAIPYGAALLQSAEDAAELTGLRATLRVSADPEALDVAAELLAAARRPLIVAGRGVRAAGAVTAVRRFAERLGALTTTTAPSIGLFGSDVFDLGVAGGFSSPVAAQTIRSADLVLVLGAGLNQFTTAFGTLFGSDSTVIQVDRLPAATSDVVDVFVRGDVAEVVREWESRVPPAPRWRAAFTPPPVPPARDRDPGAGLAPDGRLDPRSLFSALDTLLPADRVITSDGGHFIGWAPMYLRVPAADRLVLVGTALQSIGLGLSSGVGATVAAPQTFSVQVSGDGGALMALADLESIVRVTRRGVVVIVNDAAYGAEIHQYGSGAQGLAEEPMRIPEVDFAALATAAGARGVLVRTLEDLAALGEFVDAEEEGVMVLDCRVSESVVAPYMHEMAGAARLGAPAGSERSLT